MKARTSTEKKFNNGAIITFRKEGVVPMDPADVRDMALAHGVDEKVVPEYAGDRMVIFRVLRSQTLKQAREGWLLRPITRSKQTVVYGITKERTNEADETIKHDYESKMSWRAEPDPSHIKGEHAVAKDADAEYQQVRGKIVGDDWTAAVSSYFVGHCKAVSLRGNEGVVYWCPPQSIADLRKLKTFLAETVGISIIIAEIEAEDCKIAKDVATESLYDELEKMENEVKAFDGKERTTVFTLRLERYVELKKRANLYKAALGIGVDKVEKTLAELEQKVSTMLDIRKTIVVHKDGTVSKKDEDEKVYDDNGVGLDHEILVVFPPVEIPGALANTSDDAEEEAF